MAGELFFEDIERGMTFSSPSCEVTAEAIVAFAREYDPQPFHLDADAAKHTAFGKLVASGWHTAGLTMRLLLSGDLTLGGGAVGAGVESLRWPRPVVPGDVLHVDVEVVEVRASRSKPDRGIVKLHVVTRNAADEIVQDLIVSNIVPRRRPLLDDGVPV